MPEMTSYEHGAPCWTDLATPDPAAAKRFYTSLFGWTYIDNDMGGGQSYSMAQLNGLDAAAVYGQSNEEMEQGVPPRWSTYINVDDVDAVAAKVAPAGGTLMMEPFDVFDVGRMALIVDPTGAVAALWQFKAHMGARVVNEPGAMTWNELITRDKDAAATFYAEIVGWHAHEENMDGMSYTVLHLGEEHPAGGMIEIDESMGEMPSHWAVYFAVTDCDATVAQTKELGGRALVEATDIPVGRFAVLSDPQGAAFAVIQTAEG